MTQIVLNKKMKVEDETLIFFEINLSNFNPIENLSNSWYGALHIYNLQTHINYRIKPYTGTNESLLNSVPNSLSRISLTSCFAF